MLTPDLLAQLNACVASERRDGSPSVFTFAPLQGASRELVGLGLLSASAPYRRDADDDFELIALQVTDAGYAAVAN